jgi:hypothetical protein
MSPASPLRLILCGVFIALARGADDSMPEVIQQAQAWMEAHNAPFERAANFVQSGDTKAGNQVLLDLAQEQQHSPIADFVIGNMLYGSLPSESYRLHARAFAAYPKEPVVALEMAMEHHRNHEYEKAIPEYRLALGTGGEPHAALLADCLVRTGKYAEAYAAWKQAGHPHNHTGIDFAICEIYGPLLPVQRRGDLLAAIKAGKTDELPKLVRLDVNFDTDWWNAEVNNEALDADLAMAAKLLGRDSADCLALSTYAALARDDAKDAAAIRTALTKAKLVLGPGAVLPRDSFLARLLTELVVRHDAAPSAGIWAAHETELRKRIAAKDHHALHLAAMLASEAKNPAVAEFDRIGWKEWSDSEFAASYVVGLHAANKLSGPEDPELLLALKALPDDNTLNGIRLQLAGEKNLTADLIAGAIRAEFHSLSAPSGMRDSYRLKSAFYALAVKLGLAEAK